jgi:hypothetical protein
MFAIVMKISIILNFSYVCEHLQELYAKVLLLPSYLGTFVFAKNSIGLT